MMAVVVAFGSRPIVAIWSVLIVMSRRRGWAFDLLIIVLLEMIRSY